MPENASLTMKPRAPRQFSQLGVLVLDGSGSMTEMTSGNITKAQATAVATRDLFSRLKESGVAQNFLISLITYDDHPTRVIDPPATVEQLDLHADYDPTKGHGDGTKIHRALEEAERVVADYLAQAPPEGVDHSAVILLMTDGLCNEPDRTREVARRMQERFGPKLTIAAAFFAASGKADPDGERLLRDIVTQPKFFSTVATAEALREFFKATLSQTSGVAIY